MSGVNSDQLDRTFCS